jgi:hypothetical protein
MIGGTLSSAAGVLSFVNPFNPSILNQSSMMRSTNHQFTDTP